MTRADYEEVDEEENKVPDEVTLVFKNEVEPTPREVIHSHEYHEPEKKSKYEPLVNSLKADERIWIRELCHDRFIGKCGSNIISDVTYSDTGTVRCTFGYTDEDGYEHYRTEQISAKEIETFLRKKHFEQANKL